jgi:dihydroxy-acid dehydratase
MGGISANKPIIHLVTGPMMPGSFQGVRVGACTDCRSNWAKFRAGGMDIEDIAALNEELAPTVRARFTSLTARLQLLTTSRPEPAASWARRAPWHASSLHSA